MTEQASLSRSSYGVEVPYWCFSNPTTCKNFQELTELEFLPYIGCPVELSSGKNWDATPLPPETGKFHIFIWASPNGKACMAECDSMLPEKIWGIICQRHRWNCFRPSGKGISVLDDNGYAIAELIGNSLYINPPIANEEFKDGAEIYRHILQAALNLLNISSKELAERARMGAEQRKQYTIECLTAFRNTDCAKRARELENDIEKEKKELQQYRTDIINIIQRIQTQESAYAGVCLGLEEAGNKIQTLIESLLVQEHIESVDFLTCSRSLSVNTDMLRALNTETNAKHDIGKFRITFSLVTGDVRWRNITNEVEIDGAKYQAPHITEDGRATPDKASKENFVEMISNFDFVSAVTLAINIVESVNADGDDAKLVGHWPVALN